MVTLVEPDPAWPRRFAEERDALRAAAGPRLVAVEHVGSTAVPGLAAKPIIDLLGGVARLDDAAALVAPLARIGYVYVAEHEAELPERRYFRKDRDGVRAFHLHVAEDGGAFFRDLLRFRDALRARPALAAEYGRLKRELAVLPRDDYTRAKAPFIQAVLAEAYGSSRNG